MNDALDALADHFAEIIEEMPDEFDSHQFILTLAHRHQKLYVKALIAYADSEQPFATLHGQIARRLGQHTHLVSPLGKAASPNMFGGRSRAEEWHKASGDPT